MTADVSRFSVFRPYAEQHGLALFPVAAGAKTPWPGFPWKTRASRDPVTWSHWGGDGVPQCNFGLNAEASDLIIVDIDVSRVGRDAAWAAWHQICVSWGLPQALMPHVQSARGGWHCFFSRPPDADPATLRGTAVLARDEAGHELIGVKVRGYTVAAGSYYDGTAKGEASGFYTMLPDAPTPHSCPAGLIEALARPIVTTPAAAGTSDPVELVALIKFLVDHDEFEDYESWLRCGMACKTAAGDGGLDAWRRATLSTVPENEIQSKWKSFATEPRPGDVTIGSLVKRARDLGWTGGVRKSADAMFDRAVATLPPGGEVIPPESGAVSMLGGARLPNDSDDALALSFVDDHEDDLRFVTEQGRWIVWDDTRWRPDKVTFAYGLIRDHVRTFASGMTPQDARPLMGAKTINAVERLARTDRRIVTEADQWDRNPWILNTPGGTVDLRTGELRPASPDDHCTKITSVAPGGDCPLWLAFLNRVMAGDGSMIAFLQRAFGYALTGSVRDHAFYFLHGGGGNGKGVFLGAIKRILHDYAATAPIESFLASQFERHPTDVAKLAGARLAVADEIPPGRYWDETKIKRLTGGDTITARFMRQDFFEFEPTHKLALAGNSKPRLHTIDEAIKRRIHLIPFTVTIPKGERDADLPEKLAAEHPGILSWLVEGCLEWQRIGLAPPASVLVATEAYLDGQDATATWIEDCCDQAPDAWASREMLFSSWSGWATRAGERIGPRAEFLETLRNRFEEAGRNGVRGFRGIQIKPPSAQPERTMS